MNVICEVEETEIETDDGAGTMPGVRVECSRCGHIEESFGQESGSIRRCFALLRENCPNSERNYYTDDSDE